MESMNVFYRIFHEDWNPLAITKNKTFYFNHLKKSTHNDLIQDDSSIDNLEISILKYLYYEDILTEALKEIKQTLHQKLFLHIDDDMKLERLVQNHQTLVLNYLKILENNYLFEDQNTIYQISEGKTETDIFRLIYQTLDAILVFLEEFFFKYLDKTLEIPYQQRLWFVLQYKEKVCLIQEGIYQLEISDRIKQIVCKPFQLIAKNKYDRITYQQREYLSTFIKVFDKLLNNSESFKPNQRDIFAVLISLDFNTFKVFFMITNVMKNKVKRSKVHRKQLEVLNDLLRTINTTTVTISGRYDPNLPSLKEQLIIWIQEEIKFKEQHLAANNSQGALGNIQKESKEKQLLNISVPEISLFTRLLYESEFAEGHRNHLFSFISETFRTNHTAQISQESVSNHYYSINKTTLISAKRKLTKLLDALESLEEKV